MVALSLLENGLVTVAIYADLEVFGGNLRFSLPCDLA